MLKYILISRNEIQGTSDSIKAIKLLKSDLLILYPNHTDLEIYQKRK